MEVTNVENAIEQLEQFWRKQKIVSPSNSIDEILNFEFSKCVHLPTDFRYYYMLTNGMTELYPNDMDEEGFLFYPLQELTTWEDEFKTRSTSGLEHCLIFAEFMHKSWWYAVKFSKLSDKYEIGIIPSVNKFKVITQNIGTFIYLYIKDDPILYEY